MVGFRTLFRALAISVLSLLMIASSVGVAQGGLFAGACTVTMTLKFSSAITMTSGAVGVDWFNGSGTCATHSDLPWGPTKTISILGTDTSSAGHVANCKTILVDGAYDASFTPGTAVPPASGGTWTFSGSPAGGVLRMSGLDPTFEGVGVLILQPLTNVLPTPSPTPHAQVSQFTGCVTAGGSLDQLRFVGVLFIVDP